MRLKIYFVLSFSFLIAFFMDTAVFPRWNLFHIVPFVMLALTLASEHVFSIQTSIIISSFGGLFEDLLCENIVGLTSAICLIAVVIYEKLPRDSETKPFILFLYYSLLASFVEIMRALVAIIIGMRFSFLNSILYGVVPRAILTGLIALTFVAFFKPLFKRQVDTI